MSFSVMMLRTRLSASETVIPGRILDLSSMSASFIRNSAFSIESVSSPTTAVRIIAVW